MANIIMGGVYSLPMNNIAYLSNAVTSVCKPNPRRVALGLYSSDQDCRIYPTAASVILSQIKPNISTNGGIWFLAADAGPLTQIEWYCYSPNAGTITVMEVVQEG